MPSATPEETATPAGRKRPVEEVEQEEQEDVIETRMSEEDIQAQKVSFLIPVSDGSSLKSHLCLFLCVLETTIAKDGVYQALGEADTPGCYGWHCPASDGSDSCRHYHYQR
jgi:hypothetical protein